MTLMKFFIFILLIISNQTIFGQVKYNPDRLFTVDELKEDFKYLRTYLEKNQPNLYLYTTKSEMNKTFDSLYSALHKPMNDRAFYSFLTMLYGKIKDGHTYFLPSEAYYDYHNEVSGFLPFRIHNNLSRLFIANNFSDDKNFPVTVEIVSINGISAKDIINNLMKRQIRDGHNITYPEWILNSWFREYYSYHYRFPDKFEIVYIDSLGREVKSTVNSLPKKIINERSRTIETNKSSKGINISFNKDSIGLLSIPSFDKNMLKSTYNQDFKTEINSCFEILANTNCKSLILDLRDNQGGDFQNGMLLLSQLINEEFILFNKTHKVKPQKVVYSGKLFVLINGGSFSCTGMVCSALKRFEKGKFFGEECGGNKAVFSGDVHTITFPNTSIRCTVGTSVFEVESALNDGHGIKPDVTFPAFNGILNNKMQLLDFVYMYLDTKREKNE